VAEGYSIVIEGHDCSGNDFFKRLLLGFEVVIFFVGPVPAAAAS
jgi:hypothetical protein